MRNTLVLLLSAFVNLGLGALSFVWAGTLFLGLFAIEGEPLGLVSALLSLLLLSAVIVAVNAGLHKLSRVRLRNYLFVCAPMFVAGVVLYFMYAMYVGG